MSVTAKWLALCLVAMTLGCSSNASGELQELNTQLQAEIVRKDAEHEKKLKEATDRIQAEVDAHKAPTAACQRLTQEGTAVQQAFVKLQAKCTREVQHATKRMVMAQKENFTLKDKLKNLGVPEP